MDQDHIDRSKSELVKLAEYIAINAIIWAVCMRVVDSGNTTFSLVLLAAFFIMHLVVMVLLWRSIRWPVGMMLTAMVAMIVYAVYVVTLAELSLSWFEAF